MTVTDLTTAYTTLCFCFSCREWREVIMEQETHVTLLQNVIDHLLIEFCTECTSREWHRLTTLEYSASMRHWQWWNLTPDRTDVGSFTAIKTLTFIKNATTHGITHYIFVVTSGFCVLFLKVLFWQFAVSSIVFLKAIRQNLIESIVACVLFECLLVDIINGLIKLVLDLFTQIFVVDFVIIFTFYIGTEFFGEFFL